MGANLARSTLARWGPAALLIVTAAVHLPSLFGEFTNYDDDVYVTSNRDVIQPELARIADPRHHTASDWTPLVTLTHVLEFRAFGLDPLPYHVTNGVLHVATTGLVYALFRTVGVALVPALLAGLLFGIHPLQVENVAWVASRKTLLAGFFGVGSLILALRGRLAWALGAFLLAAASKGTAVVVPLWIAAAWLLGFWDRRPGRRELAWLAALGLLAALRALLTVAAQADVVERTATVGLAGRLGLMGPVLGTQLRQLLLPIDLAPVYGWTALGPGDWRVLLGWAVVLAVAGGLFAAARRDRQVALFGAWVGLGLLPTLNLWPAPFLQADRYVHLALVGASFLLVRSTAPLAGLRPWLPVACVLAWCTLVAIPITLGQSRIWRTSESLWLSVLRRDPDFADAHANLGEHYLRTSDPGCARVALERTLELRPAHAPARFNLALLEYREGRLKVAAEQVRALIDVQPDHPTAQALIGRILLRTGDQDEALRHLNRALELDATLKAARFDRANLRARMGRFDLAAVDLEAVLTAGSRAPEALNDLAAVRLAQHRPHDAIPLAEEAVQRAPGFAAAWDTLVTALLEVAELDRAERALARGLAANPELPDLHYRRARLRQLRNDPEGARAAARAALDKLGSVHRDWRTDAQRLAR